MRTNINCILIDSRILFSSPIPFLRQIMFICLCNPVTESQIRECATDGCGSFREMAGKLGVAQQCGRCACHAKEVFDQARTSATLSEQRAHVAAQRTTTRIVPVQQEQLRQVFASPGHGD
jgi:bacterioferritin-associated ferredoxin